MSINVDIDAWYFVTEPGPCGCSTFYFLKSVYWFIPIRLVADSKDEVSYTTKKPDMLTCQALHTSIKYETESTPGLIYEYGFDRPYWQ